MGKIVLPKGFDLKVLSQWYLVANRAEATIFAGTLDGNFHFLKRLENPKGKLLELQLVADRQGRSFSSSRSGVRHAYSPRTSYHEEVAIQFAARIAKMLDRAVQNGEVARLIVMAEPHFLGLIRKALPKRVKDILSNSVPREWSQGSDQDLKEYLRKKLA